MTDTGNNPFAEPDFSAFHSSASDDTSDGAYRDEDLEDIEDAEDAEDAEDGRERTICAPLRLPHISGVCGSW